MNRLRFSTVLCLCVVAATAVMAQQPTAADREMMKTWGMTLNVDKLTDQKVFTATATAHVSGPSSPSYQLILRCVVGKDRDVSLATFDDADEPRVIPFVTDIEETGAAHYEAGIRIPQIVVSISRAIRYRMDSRPAERAQLVSPEEYSNVGRIVLGYSAGANLFANLLGIDMFSKSGLPTTRLIVADVFPDETVEFSFSTLTPDARSAIQKACFAADDAGVASEAAASADVAAEAAAAAVLRAHGLVGPVRVGNDIKAPQKTQDVKPAYPAMAAASRVQGVVIIEAVIGPSGKVLEAKVVRSIPLLDAAALEAVRQWEYTPTLLDGVAVPVIMTVTVNFSLQ